MCSKYTTVTSSSSGHKNTNIVGMPVRFVSMSPLYNTYIKMFLKTINSFNLLYGTQNLFFHTSGHPINRVEVLAIVTERAVKEKFIMITLEDGTGRIRCLCERIADGGREPDFKIATVDDVAKQSIRATTRGAGRVNLTSSERPSMLEGLIPSANSDAKIGDIVLVQAHLRPQKWEDGILLICKKLSRVSDDPHVLTIWQQWTEEAIHLNENIYNKPFIVQNQSEEISRSMKLRSKTRDLGEKLSSLLRAFLLDPDNKCAQFYGYEVLEFPTVACIMQDALKDVAPCDKLGEIESQKKKLKSKHTEMMRIKFSLISAALHNFIVEGRIFKQKGFYHTRKTEIDQLDALYFVTKRCKKLVDIVSVGKSKSRNRGAVAETVKRDLRCSKFGFITDSKHYVAIVNHILS